MWRQKLISLGIGFLVIGSMSYGYAADMRRPWGSLYFRGDIKKTMQYRDMRRQIVDTHIATIAWWNHSKNLALRASMYEYCRNQAHALLSEWDLQAKTMEQYNTYVFLQTMLYQDFQTVVEQVRFVLQDDSVTLDTILYDVQSTDPTIQYFYNTLPQRYNDMRNMKVIEVLQIWLQKFFAANLRYPETIDELIEYRFIAKRDIPTISGLENISYVPHNYPYIAAVLPSSILTQAYDLKQSRYILALPVEHFPNTQVLTRDQNSMKIMMRTYDRDMWIQRVQYDALWVHENTAAFGWIIRIGK